MKMERGMYPLLSLPRLQKYVTRVSVGMHNILDKHDDIQRRDMASVFFGFISCLNSTMSSDSENLVLDLRERKKEPRLPTSGQERSIAYACPYRTNIGTRVR
jgi:hypothetical protein